MTKRLTVALTVGLGAFLLGVLIFRSDATVQAEETRGTEAREFDLRTLPVAARVSMERNIVIDCSTNPAFRNGEYRSYVTAVEANKQPSIASLDSSNAPGLASVAPDHADNIAVDCRTCHKLRKPTFGVGDRPVTAYATFALANFSKEPQKYLLYSGYEGQGKWKEYKIAPGKVQTFSWQYDNPKDQRSPVYWVGHGRVVHRVAPLATPNKDVGSLYCFKEDRADAKVHLTKAPAQPLRKPP